MNYFNPHLICLIEGDYDIRDTLITALSGEGFLTNGFKNFPEAMNYLQQTISPLSLLLANNSHSFHDWHLYKNEISKIERLKAAKFHIYNTPIDLPLLINEVSNLLK